MDVAFEIGPFRLDTRTNVLTRCDAPQTLGARAVAVLAVLVKQAPEFVSRQDLLDAAWTGLVVEESNLSVQISAIRRVLAQVEGGDRWIETLSRRGYRFVGPVAMAAPARPGGAGSTLLPAAVTSFVGRDRELVEIKRMLPNARLLSVVGAGGMGKTRLALQAAAEVAGAFHDGVCFVDLAALDDPSRVPAAAAQALGAREQAGGPSVEALVAHLRDRELLLILDNCEHVLDAAAKLADALLRGVARLTIMATSREALGLSGEQTYPVGSMSLPDRAGSAQALQRSDAVRLFVERARQRRPGFELDDGSAAGVAQLCWRLDGIPLALELAAARLQALSVEQIVARLDDRFRLLTSGSRTALPRQQTLRATLDWSHELLASREREVLRRLAVFAGGFTLEAAARVAGDGDELGLLEAVSRLVASSLVVAEFGAVGVRYRLLDTMRAYALERLADAGEVDATRRRHAQAIAGLLRSAHDDWQRLPYERWTALYAPEYDNLRAAMDWAFGAGALPALGVSLAADSGPLWHELAQGQEGRQRLRSALSVHGPATPLHEQAKLWFWLGMLQGEGFPDEALESKSRAVALYRRLGDAQGVALALVQSALAATRTGRLDDAAAALDEAHTLLDEQSPLSTRARHWEMRAFLAAKRGDLATTRADLERALHLYRAAGADRQAIRLLGNLADTRWALGDLDAAADDFREIARLGRERRTTAKSLGFCLCNLAGVLTESGRLDEALTAAAEGLPLVLVAGCAWINMDHFALHAALAGRFEVAARLAGYADAAHAARRAQRHVNERRARERLDGLLASALDPADVAKLGTEGAGFSEADAVRAVLGP